MEERSRLGCSGLREKPFRVFRGISECFGVVKSFWQTLFEGSRGLQAFSGCRFS